MKVNDLPQGAGSKRPCPVSADTVSPNAKKPAAALQGLRGEVAGASNLGGTATGMDDGRVAGDINGGSAASAYGKGVSSGGGCAAGLEGGGESRVVATAAPDPDLQILEVTNDGSAINMEMLIHLKEIFHQQLPKMPKEYIVRLVFDRKHRSIVLTKKGMPIGGITYRAFLEQKFGEIAFCAVASNSQVQGHGSRLMNELKKVAVRTDITHFHTYADNYAIGYFQKHGFTKTLSMSRDRWVSYVKDYDGGTHMECYVHPTVPYMAQAEMFKKQRDFLVKRIADISTSTRVYHGLPAAAFEDGRIHPFDIPGVVDAGWSEEDLNAQNRRKSDRDALATTKELLTLWREVEKNDNAWPFREPVDLTEVADYGKVCPHPMDLSLIKEHLDDVEPKAYYDSKERLKADFDLMINNCKTYNAEDTDYWAAADALQKSIAEIFSR